MFAPYPKIEVPADLLSGHITALRGLLAELGDICDVEACGCQSSRKINFAHAQLEAMEALYNSAEMAQRLERYARKYKAFVDED